MISTTSIQQSNILLSCQIETLREGSQLIEHHTFGYFLAGSSQLEFEGKKYLREAGTCGFIRSNQLVRFIKQPAADGRPFQSVSLAFDPTLLQEFARESQLKAAVPYKGPPMLDLGPSQLLDDYFHSFIPYFDSANRLDPALVQLKVREGILLLLHVAPALKDLLFDFTQQGKIDLKAFMENNYMHNVPMDRFAHLTGRSLTTFKTDFNRIFRKPPGKWLQERRLTEAHYLIREKGRRASDIYLDLGFEDLSHFSFAFKKQFGVPPSFA
jgi:AraC family transcriptional regulator, exoenzyme S synthesis regulatory protein ExsA